MASKDASAKQGIISHMNRDHSDSIIRYLQHYHKLSGWKAYYAKMTDIDLEGFNVQAAGKTYRIPFHPPMNSYSDARVRLVEMDKYCALYLHKSDITVKRFAFPYGKWFVSAVVTVGLLYGCYKPELFTSNGPVGKHLGKEIQPIAQNFFATYGPKIFKYIAIVHVLEVAYFTRYVLPKHSVSARAPQYWLWAIAVLFEGIGAQGRFKEVVEKSRVAKEKARH